MKDIFICESIRLQRFLYSLGFDKQSIFINGVEKWIFKKTPELQECLNFYFKIRNKNQFTGVDENANNTNNQKMDR